MRAAFASLLMFIKITQTLLTIWWCLVDDDLSAMSLFSLLRICRSCCAVFGKFWHFRCLFISFPHFVCADCSHDVAKKHEKELLIVLWQLSLSSSQLMHYCLLCAAEQQPASEDETTVTSSFLIISIQLFYYSFMDKTHSFLVSVCMLLLWFVRHEITQKYK